MKQSRLQRRTADGQEVELRILENSTVTTVPHGRGAGLIEALAAASSANLAQNRLAVIDSQRLGACSSMFDYDRASAVSLAACTL